MIYSLYALCFYAMLPVMAADSSHGCHKAPEKEKKPYDEHNPQEEKRRYDEAKKYLSSHPNDTIAQEKVRFYEARLENFKSNKIF